MRNTVRSVLSVFMLFLMLVIPSEVYGFASNGKTGDIVKLSDDIYVNEGTTVDGDVVTVRGDIYINGSVSGSAVTVFGNIIVNGKVLGDATSVTGKIVVGEKGKILGDTVEVFGGGAPAEGGLFKPNINFTLFSGFRNLLPTFVSAVLALLFTALVYLIMPRNVDKMAGSIDRNLGKSIGIGFLALIGSPIVMLILTILLAITLVGIIAIPFLWIAYIIACLVAVVPVYMYIGSKVGEIVGKRKLGGYSALAAGTLSVALVNAVLGFGGKYTGWVNAVILLLIFIVGAGTLLNYIFTRKKPASDYSADEPQGNGDKE